MRRYRSYPLQYIAAAQYARAFLYAFGDIAQHVIAMREADQRAEVSLRIENVACANALNARQNLCSNAALHFVGTKTRVPLVHT